MELLLYSSFTFAQFILSNYLKGYQRAWDWKSGILTRPWIWIQVCKSWLPTSICHVHSQNMHWASHSDHGFLTLLIENEVGGLQVEHKGKWFNANAIPNSFLVNTGDQLEVHYSCFALSIPFSPFRKMKCPNLHQPTPTFNVNYVIWILASWMLEAKK